MKSSSKSSSYIRHKKRHRSPSEHSKRNKKHKHSKHRRRHKYSDSVETKKRHKKHISSSRSRSSYSNSYSNSSSRSFRKHKKKYSSSSSRSSSSSDNSKKDAGHVHYKLNQIINKKYQIVDFLGDGTFGRVLECKNLENGKYYALKVVRPVERYIHSAKIEAEIILDILKKDNHSNYSKCVKLEEYFYFSDKKYTYIVLAFEKLGKSLYEFIKHNNYRGYPITLVQCFARQMFEGISFLHDKMKLTHTDLKPENLLLIDNKYDIIKKKDGFPKNIIKKESKNKKSSSSSTGSYTNESNEKYYVPASHQIKIIDFGGATYEDESHTEIINTRQYRAPEVILGSCQWDEKSDVWSMACILVELYTGELFFPTHNNFEHLCLIEKAIGIKFLTTENIPIWMIKDAKKELKKIFDYVEDKHTKKTKAKIDMSRLHNRKETEHAVDEMETLEDLIHEDHILFKQFLEYIFVIDPKKRPSAKEALEHEFFKFDFSKLV